MPMPTLAIQTDMGGLEIGMLDWLNDCMDVWCSTGDIQNTHQPHVRVRLWGDLNENECDRLCIFLCLCSISTSLSRVRILRYKMLCHLKKTHPGKLCQTQIRIWNYDELFKMKKCQGFESRKFVFFHHIFSWCTSALLLLKCDASRLMPLHNCWTEGDKQDEAIRRMERWNLF